MPKTVLPARQERSRRTLEKLLQGALQVLNKAGLEGATMPRIAAKAGVTPGTIYRRFTNKDALLREVYIRMLEGNIRGSQRLLSEAYWEGKSAAQMCRSLIKMTLQGHSRHRGLLRAFTSFTLGHPDAAFVRKCEDLQWKVFRAASDLLLTRRGEMRHPDPESAVPFALLMAGVSAKGVLVLPRDPAHFSVLVPNVGVRLERELPEMVLRYLGIDDSRNARRR